MLRHVLTLLFYGFAIWYHFIRKRPHRDHAYETTPPTDHGMELALNE